MINPPRPLYSNRCADEGEEGRVALHGDAGEVSARDVDGEPGDARAGRDVRGGRASLFVQGSERRRIRAGPHREMHHASAVVTSYGIVTRDNTPCGMRFGARFFLEKLMSFMSGTTRHRYGRLGRS